MQASKLKLLLSTSLILGVLASTLIFVYFRDTSFMVNPSLPRLQRDRQLLHNVSANSKTGKPLMAPATNP